MPMNWNDGSEDFNKIADLRKDLARARETMQAIMQVLGPSAVCACAGCAWETNEALRLLREAGIEYQGRARRDGPTHDLAAEETGNENSHH